MRAECSSDGSNPVTSPFVHRLLRDVLTDWPLGLDQPDQYAGHGEDRRRRLFYRHGNIARRSSTWAKELSRSLTQEMSYTLLLAAPLGSREANNKHGHKTVEITTSFRK